MKKAQDLAKDVATMETMGELTSIFEGIASMKIARIKNQVLQSKDYFNKLWQIYTQIRVDSLFRFGRNLDNSNVIDKELFIIITAEGGFSGDIDQKLITWMLTQYSPEKQDIIVIGHHGAIQLAQRGISFKKYYKLPEKDKDINVAPIIREVQGYKSSIVYYQTYVSLTIQDIKRINLSSAIVEEGKKITASEEVISDKTYIFEPSTFAVVDHLESSMLSITLGQVILESKLAQYASRFRAMSAAHTKAEDTIIETRSSYNRARRHFKDERLKEIVNGLRKASQGVELV